MRKIIYIIFLLFILTGCGQSTINLSYSDNEIIIRGSSEDKKYYESNTFYDEDIKKEIIDTVNTIEYSSRTSNGVNEQQDLISVTVDNKEVTFYEDGYLFMDDAYHKTDNGEEIYQKLQGWLHDLSYDAYSIIYKVNNEEYIIDTNLSFDTYSKLGTFDSYKKNLPLSYPLESVALSDEQLQQYQSKAMKISENYQEQSSSILAVAYTGESMTVQKEVENANITISYIKDNKVSVKKSISLQQRCTLVNE